MSAHLGFDGKWIPEPNSGCWLWFGACNEFGYGIIRENGKNIRAHRFSYEREKGEISKGYEIDHLCRNKGCVNPDHLEAVTSHENRRRANSQRVTAQVFSCSLCGAEVERKYEPEGTVECRSCIHRRACKKYALNNPCKYYYANREKLLAKMRKNYHEKRKK